MFECIFHDINEINFNSSENCTIFFLEGMQLKFKTGYSANLFHMGYILVSNAEKHRI